MDQHSDDFNQPPDFPALTKLMMFMEENVAQDQECFSLAKKLKTGFESRHKQSLLLSADSPKAYPSFGIFSLSPQHLAEQLTSIAAVSWLMERGRGAGRGGSGGSGSRHGILWVSHASVLTVIKKMVQWSQVTAGLVLMFVAR